MIFQLVGLLGLPEGIVNKIKNDSRSLARIKQASLVGCSDPTDSIPAGKVFVPGFDHIAEKGKLDKLLVSRFPCVEQTDARFLPIVRKKPTKMSQDHWNFLSGLPFGLIIFGYTPGKATLPPLVADGDLDGDLYFVNWDPRVLQQAAKVCRGYEDHGMSDKEKKCKVSTSAPNEHWFTQAQEAMVDCSSINDHGALKGVLYGLWNKNVLFLPDENNPANEFAKAYKAALDVSKNDFRLLNCCFMN